MRLDFIQTVAFAGLVLFAGYGLKRMVPVLARYNIPAPVVGGLPMAALFALLHAMEWPAPTFDTTLQTPLQNTFFASIGFGASVLVLKRGGPLVAIMMVVASVAAVLQNVVGGVTALALGQHPLMGVLAGSPTLTGGPATGLAFAPLFEEAGVTGAATVAAGAATSAIDSGLCVSRSSSAKLVRAVSASKANRRARSQCSGGLLRTMWAALTGTAWARRFATAEPSRPNPRARSASGA